MFPNGMGMNPIGMGGMFGMPMNLQNMPIQGNFGMNMPMMNNGMMPNNFNMNMPQMNIGGNENWMIGYNTQNQVHHSNSFGGNKINCIFNRANGGPINILIDNGKTVNELMQIFFKRVENPNLINNNSEICFIYNAAKIDVNSNEKVENFFKFNSSPKIIVNDVHNLIGA